jgi:C-terminal processing protease CtpA/Prc
MREKFMRGQLLWDETMAETGARYLAEAANHDKKLVIFAGGNHVRYGLGIPRRLFRRLPVNYAIVSPRVVSYTESSADKLMDVELPDLPMLESDITWFVGYEDLEDKRVKLGVSIAPAEESGVLVEEVFADSPAAEAGLSKGDIIRKLDGERVHDMFDLSYELSRKVIGEAGSITIERDSEAITLDINFRNSAR